MEQVSFDTHAAARRLVQAGASSRLAQAVVETVAEATRINTRILEDLAYLKHQGETNTASKADLESVKSESKADLESVKSESKADLAGVKGELKADLAGVKGELKTDLAGVKGELKADLAGVRGDLKVVQSDLASFKSYVESDMITKKDLYRALWVQSMGMAGLIVALMGIMLWFVRFTLITA